jgi:1-deoxyxylulose-5-phosphate synthase
MHHQRLGSTGIKISRLGLGCGNFGGIGSTPAFFGMGEDEAQAVALLDRAWDAGINLLDTADAYGGGRSERAIGRWLRENGRRDELTLTTKVFHSVEGDPADSGLAPERIRRQIPGSLERLGVDRVELYLIHEPDPATPVEATLEELTRLVESGVVGAVGASNVDGPYLAETLEISERRGLARFEWVQNSYSLLEREAEREVLPLCAEHGLGFTPFSPLAGGWLAGRYHRGEAPPEGSRLATRPGPYAAYDDERVYAGVDRLAEDAARRGIPTAALAYAWLFSHPQVDGIVVGPRRPAHLQPALDGLAVALDARDRDDVAGYFG